MFENLYDTWQGALLMLFGMFYISLLILAFVRSILTAIKYWNKGNEFIVIMKSDNIEDLEKLKYYMEQRRDALYGDRKDTEIMINSCDELLEAVNKKINRLEGK